jgi:crotonobetainyl-CoA:carnitine CoA-transferase CaiB-like acyl-CoA transferase
MTERDLPLKGVRVLDVATLVAGPFTAASLAEFGAEVIKLEKPGEGDPLRRLGIATKAGDTFWWMSDARNKICATLDLRTAGGAALFKRLVAVSDIVVENFRPGTLERWGLGYDVLRAINPKLILLRVTGYGQKGPYAKRVGVARIAEGFAGVADLTGEPDGAPLLGGASAQADYITGLYGAFGVMLALREREKSGLGQVIDLSLYEGLMRFLDELAPHYSQTGEVRTRIGAETHRSVPHSNYPTLDRRWVSIACTNDSLFSRLAAAMGRTELERDPEFATNSARIANRGAVNALVQDWTSKLTLERIVELCSAHGVPCGPVMNISDIAADPHHRERGSLTWIDDPRAGSMAVVATVPRLSDTPGAIQCLGGALGQDNSYVFRDLLGLSSPEFDDLTQQGVI